MFLPFFYINILIFCNIIFIREYFNKNVGDLNYIHKVAR